MSKTQIFIEKARAKHGDRYSYGRVAYVGARDKVAITCKKHGDFEQTPEKHLMGRGCAKCAGVHGYSTQEWIQEAVAVHGDRYSYDRVVYVRNRDKIVITCKQHGYFKQTPANHLKGKGCAKCAGRHNYSTREWVQEAIAVHGDLYDYGRVVYVRSQQMVIITCKQHGDFEQRPADHLNGHGCAMCGIELMAIKQSQDAKDGFIEKACAIHGDKYDYLKAVYVRSVDKVVITCKTHGDFEQAPNNHLSGQGCPKCGLEASAAKLSQEAKDSFIERACDMHGDKYDYLNTVYAHSREKVIITCKTHGDFEQMPNDHLRGNGCPSCPKRYDQPTNLYLMHNGLGKVKVGYSIDVDKRITQLNCHAPFKAELLESWTLPDTPTVRKIESKVHRKLAKYHAGLSGFDGASEWFNTSPERARGAILKAISGAEVLGYSEADSLQLALI